MVRCVWLALLIAACGVDDDREYQDGRYITEAILAPTCGRAECHSTFVGAKGDVFDTLVGMRRSIVDNGLVELDSVQFDPADPSNAALIQWVTKTDPFGLGIGRMPYDSIMPNSDVELLKKWITGPTEVRLDETGCSSTTACVEPSDTCDLTTGQCVNTTYTYPAQGAQCDPGQNHGMTCKGVDQYTCTADWNFGTFVQTCAGDCSVATGGCL